MDGFIDDDLAGEAWRLELQQITGYDPKKCALRPIEFAAAAYISCCLCTFPIQNKLGRSWVNPEFGNSVLPL